MPSEDTVLSALRSVTRIKLDASLVALLERKTMWKSLYFESKQDQTSFIKPSDFPDIPNDQNCAVYLDGRKLISGTYEIRCEGALVVIGAVLPDEATVEVVYRVVSPP